MAFALAPEVPARLDPPALVAPGPREVSFGRVTGRAAPGTYRVVVLVNGRTVGQKAVRGGRFELRVPVPPRDSVVRVVAHDALGNRAGRSVGPVFGLARSARPATTEAFEDRALARKLRGLVRAFPGISGIYVENLRTGAGAAWNARARFPAASTVKLAIAIEVLRVREGRLPTELDRLFELMLVHSDNEAANALLRFLGGSDEGGAGQVNGMVEAAGLGETHLYGGFLTAARAGPPLPLTVESQPAFEGKYTTAYDLAQLHRFVHLAAAGGGPLVSLDGSFTPADARFLLWVLAHSADRGKLDRYLGREAVVPHKAGWISDARHDSGLVYSRGGVFVVSVMTFTGGGAGEPSDELAGQVALTALDHFRREGGSGQGAGISFSL